MMVSQQMDSIARRQDRVEQHIMMIHQNKGEQGAAPQNIVINNKVEQVVEQKSSEDSTEPSTGTVEGALNALRSLWKNPINKALVVLGIGWGCYLIQQQMTHKQRMD